MASEKRERPLLRVFLRVYNREAGTNYGQLRFPEDDPTEPNKVDAVAVDAEGELLAMEHTRLEAFAHTLKSDAEFEPVISVLEEPSARVPSCQIILDIGFDSLDGEQPATRKKLAPELRKWFDSIKLGLPEGKSQHEPSLPSLCGRLLSVTIWKHHQDSTPGQVKVRRCPIGAFLPRLEKAVQDKRPKLRDYKDEAGRHARRVLVLERQDFDTPNSFEIRNSLKVSEARWSLFELDQVWLADTSELLFRHLAGGCAYIDFSHVWPTEATAWKREPITDSESAAIRAKR